MLFDAIGTMLPHIKSGAIRPLAVSGAKRHPSLPDVPAMNEVLPGYVAITWYGMAGPPQLPDAIVNKLSAAISEIVRQPEIVRRLNAAVFTNDFRDLQLTLTRCDAFSPLVTV